MFIALLIVGGCAPSAKVVRERTLSAADVMSRVYARGSAVSSLQGNGSITIESPDGSASGSFDLSLKKPDSLLVDLHGPFGFHVGTLMLSRNRFLFYNRMENTALIGRPDGQTLNSLFRLHMEFDEILRSFTGEFAAPRATDSLEGESVENDSYVIRFRTERGTREYHIDGDEFVVESYRLLDSAGKPTVTGIASNTEEIDGVEMPKLVRVIFPKERRAVTIAYDDLALNTPVVCSFTVPKQAEVIDRQ